MNPGLVSVDPADESGGPLPSLVNLHFLRSALHRRLRLLVVAAGAGAALAVLYLVAVPPASQGSVSFLLAQPANTDPTTGMATDISFLNTRAVADEVVKELKLPMTAEQFQGTVAATSATPNVLNVVVSAPTDADALSRTTTLSKVFLQFRADQLQGQTKALNAGYADRVQQLDARINELSKQYDTLTAPGAGQALTAQASDVLTQRSQAVSQVQTLQQEMEDTTLQTQALLSASHELDVPAVVPRSAVRRAVLVMATAVIGTSALAAGLVVFSALGSSGLRRREDVALALEIPVAASVGAVHASAWRRLLRRTSRAAANREILVEYLTDRLTSKDTPAHLVLGCAAGQEALRSLVLALVDRLDAAGTETFIADLTTAGTLRSGSGRAAETATEGGLAEHVTLVRPEGVAIVARGPLAPGHRHPAGARLSDTARVAWDRAEITLAVVTLDPGLPMDTLTSWGREMIVLVEVGHATAERLSSGAALVRRSGVDLEFAVMFGADATDESLGLPDELRDDNPSTGRLSG